MLQMFSFSRLTIASICLGLLAAIYIGVTTFISYRKLRHIPGPRLAAFSQLWLFYVTIKGDLFLTMERTLRKYGSPCRIGPNMIIQDDPDITRVMYSNRSFRRGHWYQAMQFDPRINNLVSECDEDRHSALRNKMIPGYTGKEVTRLEEKVDNAVTGFMDLIKSYSDQNQSVDLAEKIQYFTLDSITDLAFGFPFGFLTQNKDLFDYNKSSTEFFPVLELGTNIPFIWSILSSRLMQALAGPKPEDRKGFGAIIGVAQKVVAERFDPNYQKPHKDRDMLDAFVAHGLTQLEAESESLLQILAGSDSTATSMRMCVLYLLTNPAPYAKLRAEVDKAVEEGKASTPIVTNAQAQQLKYLQTVIKEGLRLWFPLNGLAAMEAPKEGITTHGVYIPGGTEVAVSKYAMLRRKDLFGEDVEAFRPERWMEAEPEKLKRMDGAFELYFNIGRSSCLGKGIALMELNKVLFELLRRYDLGLENPIFPMKTKCHTLHIQREMKVRAWVR